MFYVPLEGAVDAIDDVSRLPQPVPFARVAHHHGLYAHVFQRDEKLFGFGDGNVAVVLAVHQHHRRRPNIAPRRSLQLLNLLAAHRSSNPPCLGDKIRTSM